MSASVSNTGVYEVPLVPSTPQKFNITILGVQYQFQLIYREVDAAVSNWCLDILTSAGQPIVCSLPLVTGANLLGQYAYLGLGFQLWVATDGDNVLQIPTFDNLGTTCHLLWIADP
jgi:hypothetical protein